MSRAERLLALLELLRVHRYPVPGAVLAKRLGVSLRTLYRDIAVLQGLGARVTGEAGVGYVLRPGFTLPPPSAPRRATSRRGCRAAGYRRGIAAPRPPSA